MLHNNFKGEGKYPESTNKYTEFGQSIIWNITRIIATRCHFLKLKFTKFDSWCFSVCVLSGVWHIRRPKSSKMKLIRTDRNWNFLTTEVRSVGRAFCTETEVVVRNKTETVTTVYLVLKLKYHCSNIHGHKAYQAGVYPDQTIPLRISTIHKGVQNGQEQAMLYSWDHIILLYKN